MIKNHAQIKLDPFDKLYRLFMCDVRRAFNSDLYSSYDDWLNHLDNHSKEINGHFDADGKLCFDSEQDYFLFIMKYS